MIPVLVTDRMVLREPRLGDFEPYAAFYASPRAIHEDGPFGRDRAWEKFATSRALWSFRGYGAFSAEDRETGDYLGEFGLFQPAHYPEPELGWMVVEGQEGRGLATEAARAVRNWARRERGLTGLVNYIGPQNIRSMRVAERLGAVRDDAAPRPEGEDCVVYRHPSEDFL